jgi:hypothetical protein
MCGALLDKIDTGKSVCRPPAYPRQTLGNAKGSRPRTTACMSRSRLPPATSLTMCAPAATASRATALWNVSMEIRTPRSASSAASALPGQAASVV